MSGTAEQAASDAGSVTGAQSLIMALEHAGAENVFGIPGGAILPAYDPLFDSTRLRHILVRHEQGAGHAAQGYAAATGKVGVCMATSGPGATNLVTPIEPDMLYAAVPEQSPLVGDDRLERAGMRWHPDGAQALRGQEATSGLFEVLGIESGWDTGADTPWTAPTT